jgi:hydrogenase maturation factor
MCLTIPKKVISIKSDHLEVCSENSQKIQKVGTLIDVKRGDWVFTQNNFIIRKITQKQAQEINKIFNNK